MSGFIDAEGHFGCPIETKRKNIPYYISIVFEFGQNGEPLFWKYIHTLFPTGFLAPKVQTEKSHNRLIIKGYSKMSRIIEYIDNQN